MKLVSKERVVTDVIITLSLNEARDLKRQLNSIKLERGLCDDDMKTFCEFRTTVREQVS